MDLNLLVQMMRFNSVVGNEAPLAGWLMEQLRPHATRVEMDRLGNVFAWRGERPQVAIFSHMDSVGFIVEEVKEDHVKVVKLGGPTTPNYTPMIIETDAGAVSGTLLVKDKDYYIDLWEPDAATKVAVGDVAAFAPNFQTDGKLIHSRWLDNKLGTWVALEAWQAAKNAVFVATVREEHAPAGAGAAALRVQGLELGIVVDITYAASPEGPYIVEWGKGPAVTLRDAQVHDRRWAKAMLQVAKDSDIPAQAEIALSGGSDAMHVSLAGFPAIFVGVPIRYAHTPAEVARLSDCEATKDLILEFLKKYGKGKLNK
ncbi:MAG: M20/M25/M40 family metallo-hydrolase [Ardenticatenales bacterium]|nr:M20/M25/M40 family metallo-hydrolase [Ardenticatenales bacterium]